MLGSVFTSNGKPVYSLFDNIFNWLDIHFGGVFTAFLFFTCLLYMVAALIVGMITIGMRFLTVISVHPLEYNGTWMNAFFVNLIVFLCSNFSLTLFVCRNMPIYTSSTYVSLFFSTNVTNVNSLRWAFKYRVFEIAILIMTFLSFAAIFIYRKIKGGPRNEDEIQIEMLQSKK